MFKFVVGESFFGSSVTTIAAVPSAIH